MRTPDADIPKASRGGHTLVIVPQPVGSPVVVTYFLEDGGVDDPRFPRLPVDLRIQGLSMDAIERISDTLRILTPGSSVPSRSQLLRLLP